RAELDARAAGKRESLYADWSLALRALSPPADNSTPRARGMPSVTGTEAWGRRVLSTQLASWAELRHDTILNAKQSYTGVALWEFPDAYVDPYPDAFGHLVELAARGKSLAGDLASAERAPADLGGHDWRPVAPDVTAYFTQLERIAARLRSMA